MNNTISIEKIVGSITFEKNNNRVRDEERPDVQEQGNAHSDTNTLTKFAASHILRHIGMKEIRKASFDGAT